MTTLETATINGRRIVLSELDGCYTLVEFNTYTDEEDDEREFDDRKEAVQAFHEACNALRGKPNWEAQAAYDEEHGTDNGYAPWQISAEEY